MYTEEMTRLFRSADPAISEEKLRFLMRGFKQELLAELVRNPPRSVNAFLTEATTIEKALEMRTSQYNLHSPKTDYAEVQALSTDDLRETVRAVVREKLRKIFPESQPRVDSITDIVREEVKQALGIPEPPLPHPKAMSYAASARRSAPPRRPREDAAPARNRRQTPLPGPPTSYRPTVGQRNAPRKIDVCRAPDHRPLCYHCGEASHIYSHCQYPQIGLRGFAIDAPRPQWGERPRDIADYLAGAQWISRGPSRSPSPGRYASPQHRPYTDPTRGQSPGSYPKN